MTTIHIVPQISSKIFARTVTNISQQATFIITNTSLESVKNNKFVSYNAM